MLRPDAPFIDSTRLFLVPATVELTEADLAGGESLAGMLGVNEPDDWPPELYSRPALEGVLMQLGDRAEQGWSNWYLVSRDAPLQLVGVCSFKSRPDEAGSVEISYSVLEAFRNSGVATEAVTRLVQWAFGHPAVREVCAETFPHLTQSIRVLEKCGFSRAGSGSEHGVIRFAVSRQALN